MALKGPPLQRTPLLGALAAGLLAFALGAVLALAILPEWRTGDLPNPGPFRAQFQEIVREAGFRPAGGEPNLRLAARDLALSAAYRLLGEKAASWLTETRSGVLVSMIQTVRRPGEDGEQELRVQLSLDGRPFEITWAKVESSPFASVDRKQFDLLAEVLERQVLAPGESLGPEAEGSFLSTQFWRVRDVTGSSPPEQIRTLISPPNSIRVERRPKPPGGSGEAPLSSASQVFLGLLVFTPWALAAAVVFLFLLLKSRIDMVNGAVLAFLALVSVHPGWFRDLQRPVWVLVFVLLLGVAGRALWIFLVWSAGESLLRATRPDFSTSLDSLLRGRLGPRGGRALLLGCALGATLAGIRLTFYALSAVLPGLSPAGPSLALPVFQADSSPILNGLWMAAGVTLATAVAGRFLPDRWVLPAAALLAGFGLSPLKLYPFPFELAANVVFAGTLVWICRRLGLSTLIVAAVVSFLLPTALYSGLHANWLPGTFAITTGITAGIVLLGLAGLARSEDVEAGALPPPAFMRRLAHERRLQYEVDLLARMQVGLLPQEMPRIEGYEIAARSVLASEAGGDLYDFLRDEAGGLWIAAGDVAGHGYSCAVAQAMVKAGLFSLVAPGEVPAGVLHQLDRVLRGVSTDHSFTSLALIRLDPATGAAVLGNAGYPYPLVFAAGRVSEIDLPGRPLGAGRGVSRPYEDRAFELPRGGALLLCSDGLFEVLDRNGNAYGFDRAREVLQAMGHRPAVEIVDALLNDCRRHLGAETPPDDVTVVVVKRGN
jgi:Stage II sporulation protein E (SpoIIE)